MNIQKDRRSSPPRFILENLVLPIIIATATGVGSSFIATRIALSVLETKFLYVEKEVVSIQEILKSVKAQQIELAERAVWMRYANKTLEKVDGIEADIKEQERRIERLERRRE